MAAAMEVSTLSGFLRGSFYNGMGATYGVGGAAVVVAKEARQNFQALSFGYCRTAVKARNSPFVFVDDELAGAAP